MAVVVGSISCRNIHALSCSIHLSLSVFLSVSFCLCLSMFPTKNHPLTITLHRATKDTSTKNLMHTNSQHTHGTHWLPSLADKRAYFVTWEICLSPNHQESYQESPIREALQTEDCKGAPPALPARVFPQEETESRIRTTSLC